MINLCGQVQEALTHIKIIMVLPLFYHNVILTTRPSAFQCATLKAGSDPEMRLDTYQVQLGAKKKVLTHRPCIDIWMSFPTLP